MLIDEAEAETLALVEQEVYVQGAKDLLLQSLNELLFNLLTEVIFREGLCYGLWGRRVRSYV